MNSNEENCAISVSNQYILVCESINTSTIYKTLKSKFEDIFDLKNDELIDMYNKSVNFMGDDIGKAHKMELPPLEYFNEPLYKEKKPFIDSCIKKTSLQLKRNIPKLKKSCQTIIKKIDELISYYESVKDDINPNEYKRVLIFIKKNYKLKIDNIIDHIKHLKGCCKSFINTRDTIIIKLLLQLWLFTSSIKKPTNYPEWYSSKKIGKRDLFCDSEINHALWHY